MKKLFSYILPFVLLFFIDACKKTDTYQSDQLADYLQLQVGKYIIYRMDSLQYINFGTEDTIVSYLAKDVIEDSVVDNLGRPSWRVIRYLSDTTGTAPWLPNEEYLITATRETVEVVENNLRFQKLKLPIVDGFNWKGNSYIEAQSINSDYTYLYNWDYTYDSVGLPRDLAIGTIPNTITVQQRDVVRGNDTSAIQTTDYSEEVYAKGIGLIYKNFLHSEYQPPNVSTPVATTNGYGLKLSMVDHN
jgi:hypothetical protein